LRGDPLESQRKTEVRSKGESKTSRPLNTSTATTARNRAMLRL
jgi:hypothetical protein